jgi:hypothetical protein
MNRIIAASLAAAICVGILGGCAHTVSISTQDSSFAQDKRDGSVGSCGDRAPIVVTGGHGGALVCDYQVQASR